MAQGKGISEAVRDQITQWVDPTVRESLTKEIKKTAPTYQGHPSWLATRDNWVRVVRRKIPTGGFVRTYRNNSVNSGLAVAGKSGVVELEVRSNQRDTRIEYFAFRVNGKFVAGGLADVSSVNVASSRPNKAVVERLGPGEIDSNVVYTPGFRRLSEAELIKINTKSEYGDGFDRLFTEREV